VNEANHDTNTLVATTQNLPNLLTDHILTNCQISMSLEQLLALVPRFRNNLERLFHPSVNEEPKPTIPFVNPTNRPMVLDDQCPTISVLIQGEQIHDVIIDGGSGVNVIS
jgi:hypothetical protein